jgi:mono/diheme cytochrome c family protein
MGEATEKVSWGRRIRRIALALGGLIAVTGLGCVSYVQLTYRRDFGATPLPRIEAERDTKAIERGAYVANALAHCSACHGDGQYTNQRKLPPDLRDLRGGYTIDARPFGTFRPSNLTSDSETGIGKLSDGEVARVIRHGVAPDGHLYPLMSFAVGPMADEDLRDVISYLRSLPAQKNQVAADEWGFVAKALSGRFGPRMENAPPYVARGTASVERGAYLANGPALCFGCHTPKDAMHGMVESGVRFSGGGEPYKDATDPDYELMPPNLTPDAETGVLVSYTEDAFVDRFKKVSRAYAGSPMPWENFALMTEEDLRSIFRFLRSVPPTKRATGPTRRRRGWKG